MLLDDDSQAEALAVFEIAETSPQKENKNIKPIQNEDDSARAMMALDTVDSASQKEIYGVAKSSREVQEKPDVTKENFTAVVQQSTNSANYKQISNKLE